VYVCVYLCVRVCVYMCVCARDSHLVHGFDLHVP